MFDNIGGKIKTVASTLTVLGIILSILAGLITLLDGEISGLFVMIFGSLFSWLGSFLLYGFGQLVENSDKLVALLDPSVQETSHETAPSLGQSSMDVPQNPPADWVCFACGYTNFHRVKTCQSCGITKHWSDTKHAETLSKEVAW